MRTLIWGLNAGRYYGPDAMDEGTRCVPYMAWMVYFEKNDILHLSISDEPEAGSVELNPNVTAELNKQGDLIGIEIINASAFIRDSILESVQAKLLNLVEKPITV